METMYATFKVEVADSEYSYQGQRGEAEMKIQVPRTMLEKFDPGALLTGVMLAALTNYDDTNEPDENEE